jgi:hypothetical protein
LLILSTVSFSTADNFVSAAINLKSQRNGIQQIMYLHDDLLNAKLNLGTDLALELSLEKTANHHFHLNWRYRHGTLRQQAPTVKH